jgi:quinol-cytochrome oxidoreductase complex cytochrome b subunit
MIMADKPEYQIEQSADPVQTPQRLAYFPEKVPARFEEEKSPEKLVMSFPNLIIREVICFLFVVIVLSLVALLFNAPLEELAEPQHTPNPAKAPWYFLGLQELLHSFPPVVAGVLIPLLVVIALVIIPYFDINYKREGLWIHNKRNSFLIFSGVILVMALFCIVYDAYSIAIPSLLLYAFAILPYFVKREKGWIHWLSQRSLSEWVMTWFVLLAVVLTIIGTFFRGPGWSWVWPWK